MNIPVYVTNVKCEGNSFESIKQHFKIIETTLGLKISKKPY